MKRANEEGVVGRRIDVGSVNSTRNSSRRKSEPFVVDYLNGLARTVGIEQQAQQQQPEGEDVVDASMGEKPQILLPDSYSKKGIYREFIYQQGYLICEHRGGPRMKDYTLRSDSDWSGRSPGPICSIACFVAIWHKDCRHIQINNQQHIAKKDPTKDDRGASAKDENTDHVEDDLIVNNVGNIDTNNNDIAPPPNKKAKLILSDRSGNPYVALREAHELLLEENQQLRERAKDEKESFQEEIRHLKERVQFLEMQIRSARANRGAF